MPLRLSWTNAAAAVIVVAIAVIAIIATRDSGGSAELRVLENRSTTPAVVSAHELATAAGMEILERGGTAADAAIAVAATLSVVEPWFSSALGGGTWALYYDAAPREVTSLDGVGPTGSNASVENYAPRAEAGGIHQSIVPGAWDGWMLWLDRYGELELGDVLAPAISVARDGYPIGASMASWLDRSAIAARPATAEIYAPDGVVLREGETVYQHDLADTFEALAGAYDEHRGAGREAAIQAARDYFYRGPLAEAIVRFSDEHGGYLTTDDFASFEAEIVEPISVDYNDDVKVFQNPPNSQGITMLIALNILKGFDFTDYTPDDPDAIHVQAEALKLAFADRYHHVGDPDRVDIPVAELLSDEHADRQRERIAPDRALSWPLEDTGVTRATAGEITIGDTTTFHVVDSNGNAAAVTTSLGAQFLVVDGTGINMNNRMRFLALDEGDPNQLEPGYKVRHTSNPYMAFLNDELYILGGNTGVDTQVQAQLQQFLHVVEFGLTAQEAIAHPRFVIDSFPATTFPFAIGETLSLEEGFPAELVDQLESRGHSVEINGATFGSGAMIVISDDNQADVGSEPRSETATGEVGPHRTDLRDAAK